MGKKESKNVDKSVIVWVVDFIQKINTHNFWMEYAISLKQVSTCFWDNNHQFCTWFEQIECCMSDL